MVNSHCADHGAARTPRTYPSNCVMQYTGTFQGLREGLVLRGEATDNANMTIESRLCVQAASYLHSRENERYHSQSCAGWQRSDPDRAGRTDPPPDMMRLWAQRVPGLPHQGSCWVSAVLSRAELRASLPNAASKWDTARARKLQPLDPLGYTH